MSFELDVATHKSLPRAAQLYVFDERPCDSPFVEKVWRTRGVLARGFISVLRQRAAQSGH